MITIPAHIEGNQIVLDEQVELKPTMRVVVTLYESEEELSDAEMRYAFMQMGQESLKRIWDNDKDAIYDSL
jgi:hypothetical protein